MHMMIDDINIWPKVCGQLTTPSIHITLIHITYGVFFCSIIIVSTLGLDVEVKFFTPTVNPFLYGPHFVNWDVDLLEQV